MRLFLFSLLTFGLLLSSCNNNKPGVVTSEDGKTKVEITPATAVMEDIQKKTEALRGLTPLTTDQMKALLPEELMGMKRSSFNATSPMGYSMANATYKKEDGDQRIQLTIIDCAGDAGAGFYSINYAARMNSVSENEYGYTKTTEFNGGKAVESYKKNSEEYQLLYIANDRLLVTVEGEKIGLDAVKDVAKNLNLTVK